MRCVCFVYARQVGWLLLDGADPTHILQRSQEHVLIPTYPYETLCNGPCTSFYCRTQGPESAILVLSMSMCVCVRACVCAGAKNCTYRGERKNVIFACSATLLPADFAGDVLEESPGKTHSSNTKIDHIRLFFGGGDGNVGTAVIRVESTSPPAPPAPRSTVPSIKVRDASSSVQTIDCGRWMAWPAV